jgi:hypothetical protein
VITNAINDPEYIQKENWKAIWNNATSIAATVKIDTKTQSYLDSKSSALLNSTTSSNSDSTSNFLPTDLN